MSPLEASAVSLIVDGFSPAQVLALRFAYHEGSELYAVHAGMNITRRGTSYRLNASTLRALASRGYVALHLGSEGGMSARLTELGRTVACVLPVFGRGAA